MCQGQGGEAQGVMDRGPQRCRVPVRAVSQEAASALPRSLAEGRWQAACSGGEGR